MPPREPHYLPANVPLPATERSPLILVLDGIRSAYNVGSAFRTGDAAAVQEIWLCGFLATPPHKEIAKTALGAQDYVAWRYYREIGEAIRELREAGTHVVAVETSPEAVPYTAFKWPQPVAILFGNEVTGLSQEDLEACSAVVSIPMLGHKETLNVATAIGVVLFEALRQWGRV